MREFLIVLKAILTRDYAVVPVPTQPRQQAGPNGRENDPRGLDNAEMTDNGPIWR